MYLYGDVIDADDKHGDGKDDGNPSFKKAAG